MDNRFERRLELAKNPRARKRNGKRPVKFVRPKSHVAAVVGEILDGATSGGGRICHPNPYVMARDGIGAAAAPIPQYRRPHRFAAIPEQEPEFLNMSLERRKLLPKCRDEWLAKLPDART